MTTHNPNIHALITKFFTNLGFTTPVWEQPWVTKFNNLYTSVDEEKNAASLIYSRTPKPPLVHVAKTLPPGQKGT